MTERKPGRPPERVTLTIYAKVALSTAGTPKTFLWPKAWPIPQQGDQISFEGFSGIVMNLHFKPDENTLIVNLR